MADLGGHQDDIGQLPVAKRTRRGRAKLFDEQIEKRRGNLPRRLYEVSLDVDPIILDSASDKSDSDESEDGEDGGDRETHKSVENNGESEEEEEEGGESEEEEDVDESEEEGSDSEDGFIFIGEREVHKSVENSGDAVVQLHCGSNEPDGVVPSQVLEAPSRLPEIAADRERGEVDDHDKEKTKNKRSYCLPEEIQREICLRLPVKTFLRFRSLDKNLRNLISTQQFMTDHLNTFRPKEDRLLLLRSSQPTNIGCCLYLDGVVPEHMEDIPLPYGALARYQDVTVVGCCNGVVCRICISMHNKDVLFLSPSIRKVAAIPLSHLNKALGFGLVGDDYKLVAIPSSYREAPLKAYVFSLKTRNWVTVTFSWSQLQPLHFYVTSDHFLNTNKM